MSVQHYGLGVKIAQMVGVGLSAYTSGLIGSISIFIIPSLFLPTLPPTLASKQWLAIFDLGKKLGPVFSILAGAALEYLAWTSTGRTGYAYGVAAGATLLVAPFTLVVMMPTNNWLMAHARGEAGVRAAGEEEVRGKLRLWAGLNAARAALPGLGAVVGFAAVLGLFE